MRTMPDVNHEILAWARETAGLTREEAVGKIGLRDARGVAAVRRLEVLESGAAPPSRPLLVRMARQYRRPLLTFYLSTPPRRADRGADFRSLPERRPAAAEAVLDALLRDIRARQGMVRAVLEDEGEAEPLAFALAFVESCKMSDGKDAVLAALRALVGVDRSQYRAGANTAAAFALLRAGAEKAGVFVLLKGNLGSHHTAVDVEVFRGFALADEVAPFVVVNDGDAHAAWSFTLLHELTHLLLGQTGVSDARAENRIERFCNDVASAWLLPTDDLGGLDLDRVSSLDAAAERIGEFASVRHLSRTTVAYAALRAGIIEQAVYDDLGSRFRRQWLQAREARRARAREGGGGPDIHTVRRHRAGDALIGLVGRMMSAGALTTTRAAMILGVKPKSVQSLLNVERAT